MFHKNIAGSLCVYCGEPATTKDHFPPKSASKTGVLLPACNECNGFIGNRYPFDFDGRCASIKLRIKNKYMKILNSPSWSEEELNELTDKLRSYVENGFKQKELIRCRIDWNIKAYIDYIDIEGHFDMLIEQGYVKGSPRTVL